MVILDQADPADVIDRQLWRDAQLMLGRHAEPNGTGDCTWCGGRWPCPPRRLAEYAAQASRRLWREAWTMRHDLNGLRSLPGWRADLGDRSVRPPARGNAGPFHG